MLPARHRLRERTDFASVIRGRGATRSGGPLIVVHVNRTDTRADAPPRVGLVVSGGVGNAVVRNRTKRRLRAIMSGFVGGIEPGTDVVLRANAAAAVASHADLLDAVERGLVRTRALRPVAEPAAGGRG